MSGPLEATLAGMAESLGVDPIEGDGTTEWQAGGTVFAAVSGSTAEFRLAPAVAEAARRTDDAGTSPRGPEWVAFRPPKLDDRAADRATAWFASAHRRATAL
jgi:hypothetical protein